ncbi:TPA: YSIRK-type signal peptide-containing protein, partial [Enterococcus hirae]
MDKQKFGDKKIKYALRKFSQGVFSVAIGSVLLYGIPVVPSVNADTLLTEHKRLIEKPNEQEKLLQVEFIPILKTNLSTVEQEKISKELPKTVLTKNQKYYLVYEKNNQSVLPKTDDTGSSLIYIYIGSGMLLASWILLSMKAKKSKFLFSVLLLNAFTGTNVLGLSMIDDPSLERYHQTFEVPIGSSLPQIDPNIPGYTFYGYAPAEETQSNHVPTNPVTSDNVGTTSENEVNDQAQPMKKESNAEKNETVTEPIPYQTQTIDNPELAEG